MGTDACRSARIILAVVDRRGIGDRAAPLGLVYASLEPSARIDSGPADVIADARAALTTSTDEPRQVRSMTGRWYSAPQHMVIGALGSSALERCSHVSREHLPPAPSTTPPIFRDCRDDVGALPPAELIHLGSREVPAFIASSSPTGQAPRLNGCLGDVLCEATPEEGLDAPSETAVQSAREFLKDPRPALR